MAKSEPVWQHFDPRDPPRVFEFKLSLPSEVKPELPPASDLFAQPAFTVPALMRAKDELNTTRSKLDHLDLQRWSQHTNFTSLTSWVVRELRNQVNPELCTIAWCKMYEMLTYYPLVTRADIGASRFRSFHLCEAPGGFICALNHYLRTREPPVRDWDWRGITLNPYNEGNDLGAMVDDDRFIRDTMKNWTWGTDNTGNVMHVPNIRHCWQLAREQLDDAGVDLVTADGSVDCQSAPNEQERLTSALHYAEAVAALGLLRRGGRLVLKMFTLFEDVTVGLLYILACVFEQLHVLKPLNSKWGNGETYVVGEGFRGIDAAYLEALLQHVQATHPADRALVPREAIPAPFLEQLTQAAVHLSGHQRDTIEENIRLFQFPTLPHAERGRITRYKTVISRSFADWFRIRRLPSEAHIVTDAHIDGSRLNTGRSAQPGDRMRVMGTLEDRRAAQMARQADRAGQVVAVLGKRERGAEGSAPGDAAGIPPAAAAAAAAAEGDPASAGFVAGAPTDAVADADAPAEAAATPATDAGATAVDGGAAGDARADRGRDTASVEPSADNDAHVKRRHLDADAEHKPVFSDVAQRLMQKMGHREGQGLGAAGREGRATPLLPQMPVGREGLGRATARAEQRAELLQGADDLRGEVLRWQPAPLRPLDAAETARWSLQVGERIALLSLSRFIGERPLFQLRQARRAVDSAGVSAAAAAEQLTVRPAQAADWACVEAGCLAAAGLDGPTISLCKQASYALTPADGGRLPLLDVAGGGLAEYAARRYGAAHVRAYRVPLPAAAAGAFRAPPGDGVQELGLDAVAAALPDGVALAAAGLPGGADECDPAHKRALLQCLRVAVAAVRAPNGVLVLLLGDTFSRFTVGLLYALARTFRQVGVCKPHGSSPATAERFLLCTAMYAEAREPLLDLLVRADRALVEAQAGGRDVLELVPVELLTQQGPWADWVRGVNETLAARQTLALQTLVR